MDRRLGAQDLRRFPRPGLAARRRLTGRGRAPLRLVRDLIGGALGGLAAMVALGLACFCLINGTEIWPWRGLAFTPVMAFYVVVASRRPGIRDLFASEPEVLITGAATVAAGWSLYATATMGDPAAGSAWYPTTATLTVIALLYALDAHLRGDRLAPALSLGAFVAAWI